MKKLNLCFLLFLLCSCASVQKANNSSPTKKTLQVASVQFPIEGKKSEKEFLKKVKNYIEEARSKNAELIVFPELFSLDLWPIGSKLKDRKIVEKIASHSPSILNSLIKFSSQYSIDVLAGSLPVLEKGKLFNRSFYIKPSGELIPQDKLTLTPWGKEVGFTIGSKIKTIPTSIGHVVILICYDAESPQISNALTNNNVDLILVPSMTESEEGFRRVSLSSKTRAIEHHAYVVVSGTVGSPEKQWLNIGQAGFFNPQYPGYPAFSQVGKKNKPGLSVFEFDMEKLRKTKKEKRFYPASETLDL